VPTGLLDQLRRIVGAPHVLTGVECSPYAVEGRAPTAVVLPGTREEVAAAVILAGEQGLPVTPWGGGTKMWMGSPPSRVGLVLSLKRLDRILEHEPGDLTVTVEAGLTLDRLQAELGKRGQWLSLDPAVSDRATVGGILASDASGPRRHLYGTARDLVIGLTVIGADGRAVRGGGKVVKNVAGYDLPKLYIGSFGTLGVLVEATFKLRPRADVDRLVIARFDRLKDAGQGARAVLGSDLVPSAVELVDDLALQRLGLGSGAALLVGLDGIAPQVEWEVAELDRLLVPLGRRDSRELDGAARDETWRALGALERPGHDAVAAVMRWAVLPMQMAELMDAGAAAAQRNGLGAAMTGQAGVGIVTASLSGSADPGPVVATLGDWRDLAVRAGGHAMVAWAPLAVKERVPVWDEPGPTLRLMKGIKERLDPGGILNPGRFVGGI
jgi:glycolate oxidase FAD binding subunit